MSIVYRSDISRNLTATEVDNNFRSLDARLQNTQGAQGPAGATGPQGAQGPAGATGDKGDPGSLGNVTLFSIGLREPVAAIANASSIVVHDASLSNIFNHTNIAGNFTCNVTNLNLPVNNATSITLILNQGTTPYMPTAFQIAGVVKTINWPNGIVPAGTASKIDVVSFSILNNSGTYVVLGSLNTFG